MSFISGGVCQRWRRNAEDELMSQVKTRFV